MLHEICSKKNRFSVYLHPRWKPTVHRQMAPEAANIRPYDTVEDEVCFNNREKIRDNRSSVLTPRRKINFQCLVLNMAFGSTERKVPSSKETLVVLDNQLVHHDTGGMLLSKTRNPAKRSRSISEWKNSHT